MILILFNCIYLDSELKTRALKSKLTKLNEADEEATMTATAAAFANVLAEALAAGPDEWWIKATAFIDSY